MIGAAAQMALGVVPSLITTGMNIGQLVGAKKAQEEARKKFEAGVQDVKNQMQRNVQEGLRVQDESTRLKYMQDLAALKQLTDTATTGGQRTTLAAIPGLQAGSQAASEQDRLALQKREDARTKAILDQEEVLRSEEKEFSEEMAGIALAQEQQARKDRQELLGSTITGLGNIATTAVKAAPLYAKDAATRKAGRLVDSLGGEFEGLTRDQALDAILESGLSNKEMRDARRYGQGGIDEILQAYYQGLQPNTATGVGLSAPLTGFSGMSLTPQSQPSPFDIGINQRFFNPKLTINNPGLGNPMQYNPSYLSLLNPNG